VAERKRICTELDELKLLQSDTNHRLKAALIILREHNLTAAYEDNLELVSFSVNPTISQASVCKVDAKLYVQFLLFCTLALCSMQTI